MIFELKLADPRGEDWQKAGGRGGRGQEAGEEAGIVDFRSEIGRLHMGKPKKTMQESLIFDMKSADYILGNRKKTMQES